MSELVHIAGPVVRIGTRQRQRCMWCGAMLTDYDLVRLAVEVPVDGPPPPGPATWEVGALIGVDGENPKVSPGGGDGLRLGVGLPERGGRRAR